MGIKNDGTLWGWGQNQHGQLGDGSSINKNIPVQIGSDSDWADVELGLLYTMAIKTDGSLWGWGNNLAGQLGDVTNRFIPMKIGNDKWKQISTGYGGQGLCGIKMDGTLWSWGNFWNPNINNISNAKNPILIKGLDNCKQVLTVGGACALIIKNDGTLWGYGIEHTKPYLGLGVANGVAVPLQQIGSSKNWAKMYDFGFVTRTDGSFWVWSGGRSGKNGEFGSGTDSYYNLPTQLSTNLGTIAIDISCGDLMTYYVKTDGTLWGTGKGFLGDGTPHGSRFAFTQVGKLNIWSKVTASYTAREGVSAIFAIQTNGSLWVSGSLNAYGMLGIGDSNENTQKLSFTLVD